MEASEGPAAHPRAYAWFSGLIAEDFPLLDALLAHGLPVDVQHPLRHTTALMEAVRRGRAPLVSWLLRRGAAPALVCGSPKGSPLHGAISLKHWGIAGLLIEALDEVAAVDGHQRTPLHILCMEALDHSENAQILSLASRMIAKLCPLDALDAEGIAALHYCVINDQYPLADLLLTHGASPDIRTPDSRVSPLIIAALEKNMPLATLLLEHGADPHLPTHDGMTAAGLLPALARIGPENRAASFAASGD